ncbi:MAG: HYC_CC_PP family protein [Bacteroidales bacterium]
MRKIVSIVLLILMLLSSGGFTIARHVCSSAGVFVKIGLLGTTADCGMKSVPSSCPSHKAVDNPACCKDTVQTLRVDIFTLQPHLQLPKCNVSIPLLTIYPIILFILQPFNSAIYTNERASLFLHVAERLAVICVFRK